MAYFTNNFFSVNAFKISVNIDCGLRLRKGEGRVQIPQSRDCRIHILCELCFYRYIVSAYRHGAIAICDFDFIVILAEFLPLPDVWPGTSMEEDAKEWSTQFDCPYPIVEIRSRVKPLEGSVWVYRQYSQDERLIKIETIAREAGIGLWNRNDTVPPWDWRKGKRSNRRPAEQTQ